MTHATLLDQWGNDLNFPQPLQLSGERLDARSVNAIVVSYQDIHALICNIFMPLLYVVRFYSS